jgi:DNA-binding phage protein
MAKVKTSKKRPAFSVKVLTKHKSDKKLLSNPEAVKQALLDAIANNDLEAVREVLAAHLNATSKLKLSKKTGIGRQTLYDLTDSEKEFNPRLKTLGAIFENLLA